MIEDEITICEENNHNHIATSARTMTLTMVLSFAFPVIILVLAFLKVQIWPGGKFTPFIYDMSAQFNPVITSIRYIIGGSDNSVFLSFYGALGNSALLNYAAYIADPIMWVTVLFPLEQMPNVLYFITLLKIGLCGASVSLYFWFGVKGKKYPVIILILSICYSLMSYNIMYSQCIIWFNVIALAPITLLGIEKIIDGGKGGIYVLCMTLSLYYNYQLAYMLGIFAFLYLIWRLSEHAQNWRRVIVRFVGINVLCAGMFAPVFVPVMFNVIEGRMKTLNSMAGTLFYYSIWDVLKRFMSCQYDTIESRGLPMIFCGSFIPLISVVSLFLPIKPVRSRVISACILLFFMLSFILVPLNQFWHGFNEPNSFSTRYSFLFCLYLLVLAYRAIHFTLDREFLSKTVIYFLYGTGIAIACIEMYLNAGYILSSLNLEMGYGINASYQRQISNTKDVLGKINDNDFYRIGRDMPYSFNDGMLFGYNGIGYFSSMFERNAMDFIGQLGYSQYEHTLRETGGTPLAESLLGVRYKVLREPQLFGYYESIYSNKIYDLQYNKYALPLGFLVDYKKFDPNSSKELIEEVGNHNSLAFQEFVLSELRGERVNAYEYIDYEVEQVESDTYAKDIKMRFKAKDERPVWIYCKDEYNGMKFVAPESIKSSETDQMDSSDESSSDSEEEQPGSAFLKVNGLGTYPFVDRLSTMAIYLGTFKPGQEVEVEAACVNPFEDPWIAYYNEDECNAALNEIKQRGFKIYQHENGVIKGRISVKDDDDLMIMSLPYMKGFQVKVDGVKTEYGSYRNALLALKMDPGVHDVEISFVPYGLIPGCVIGIIFLAIAILYLRGASFGKHRFTDTE